MIFILDNYDSFTYNLVQRLGEIDGQLDLVVRRNDEVTVDEVLDLKPSHVIVSPGPCTPNEAGVSMELIRRFAGRAPLLGVCLGHQSMGQAFGAKIVRAKRLMHGKTDAIHHAGQGIFSGLPEPLIATRYHSLLIQPDTLSKAFEVTAYSDSYDGPREIMAIEHREYPLFGVQFHPESFLTTDGTQLLKQFLAVSA